MSIRETAASGEAPFSAVKAPFIARTDERGRVWVLDADNARIRVFDRDGGFLGGWGGHGNGQLAFQSPEGLAISGDNLYVADTWNHRVVHYTLSGEWKGSVTGFMGPRGVAVGPDGSVWVADTGNDRVVRYDAELKNEKIVGGRGTEPGEFKGPVSIAFGPSGSAYITDAANGRIQVLDKAAKYQTSWSIDWLAKSWQARLETDRKGTVYLSNPGGAEVLAFNPSGALERRWTEASGEKLLLPIGLGADRKRGILYVADIASHRLLTVSLPH